MTKEEFEVGYAARSGFTVDELCAAGCHAEPCDCGEPDCRGWKMVTRIPFVNSADFFSFPPGTLRSEKSEKPGELRFTYILPDEPHIVEG